PYIGLLTTFNITESATSNPIANAEVSIPGYGTKTTDVSGNVTFLVDSVASYNYTVSHPNYFDSTGSLFVKSDTALHLSLETVYKVMFTVTDKVSGDSIGNAKIYLEHYDTLTTNAQGQVTCIDVFVEDSLKYTVSANGYFSTQGYVDVVDQDVLLNDTLTPLPVITTNASLVDFESYADSVSEIQSYSVSGEHLLDDVIIKVSGEYEISTNFLMEYVDSVSLSPVSGSVGPETIYVRMKTISNTGAYPGNILHYSASADDQNIPLSGQVIAAPVISVNEALTDFSTEEGTASASQSYTVEGYHLIDTIFINASSKIEISTDDINYVSSVQLIPVNDTVRSTDIYVRVKSSAGTGSLDEQIEHISDDANPALINISGFVSILDVLNELNHEDNILLYPNAADQTVTIRNDMTDAFTIEIINLEGKIFKTIHAGQNEINIDIRYLQPGLYTVKIMQDESVYIKKLLKE
ncbi:MAG: T9SS type A sorting domain-containing protein, partial [Bacteroidota bacterium]